MLGSAELPFYTRAAFSEAQREGAARPGLLEAGRELGRGTLS
jgi:hypothetical protein